MKTSTIIHVRQFTYLFEQILDSSHKYDFGSSSIKENIVSNENYKGPFKSERGKVKVMLENAGFSIIGNLYK